MAFPTNNLAVFIDYENFARDRFETEILLSRLKQRGRVLVKRAYADWGRFAEAKRSMRRAGVDLIELPSQANGKNQADIRLVVDALEIALTRDYINTFVLVSGDSDMSPLVSKLREWNRYVIVVARPNNLSSLLAGCCDEFIYYRDLIRSAATEPLILHPVDEVLELTQRAWKKLRDAGGPLRGSSLKSQMLQLNPDFNQQRYGCRQFKDFVQLLAAQGTFDIRLREDGDFDLTERNELTDCQTQQVPLDLWGSPTGDEGSLEPVVMSPVPTDENLGTASHDCNEWMDVIWWASRLTQPLPNSPGNSISLSRLVATIKKLYPGFSPIKHGFCRSGGFKKMLQSLEASRWCELHSDSKGGFVIHWRPEFLSRVPAIAEPDKTPQKSTDPSRYRPDRIVPLRAADVMAKTKTEPLRQRLLISLLENQDAE